MRIAFGHSPSETSIRWEQRGWIEYGILETVTRDCLEENAGELRLIVAVGGSAPAQACDRFAAQRQGNAGAELRSFRPAQADARDGASHYKRVRFAAEPFGNIGFARALLDKAGMQAKTSRVRIACWP